MFFGLLLSFSLLLYVINLLLMAIAIKSIPTLIEKDAKVFVKKAEATVSKRATVNFSKQMKATQVILKKAKMH